MLRGDIKYHHLGMPAASHRPGEKHIPALKIYTSGYESSEFGIEWMYYDEGCELPEIVRKMPHLAFEVDDIRKTIEGKRVIIQPNSPSAGVLVAFIEMDGLPIEFIQLSDDRSKETGISGAEAGRTPE